MQNEIIQEDFQLYQKGIDYNGKLSPAYYDTTDTNEAFYALDQWRGVVSNGLPTPVFPIFKRVIDHKIASILSQKVTLKYSVENIEDETQDQREQEMQDKADMLTKAVANKWEKDKMDTMLRELLLDGSLSGDYCVYVYWDSEKDTKQTYGVTKDAEGNEIPAKVKGDFTNEKIDGANVMFGNPNDNKVQKQPYILIVGRGLVSELKAEAKRNKVSQDDIDKITSDLDNNYQVGDRGKQELDAKDDAGKCLYVIKLWKKDGKVIYRKSTKHAIVIPETDTGLTRYPIAFGNWYKRKNSYHGQAEGTGLVPNQIAVNQLFAMCIYFMRQQAFGKVIFDGTRLEEWDNRVGSAIKVNGPINDIVHQLQQGQMNESIYKLIDMVIQQTKKLMGADDAVLGDINPEQASGRSIIAVQQQASIPLENIKQGLYQFVEDLGLIWQDFIMAKYDIPRKITYEDAGKTRVGEILGSDYKDIPLSLKIDVGPSSYWSELTSIETLDNLLNADRINFLQYLERLPDGYINKKEELMEEIEAMQDQQMVEEERNVQYEQMAQFIESLPIEIQQQLEALRQQDTEQYEQAVLQLMQESTQ